MTNDFQIGYARWLDTLPPAVQAVARKYPHVRDDNQICCYRTTDNPRHHVTIHAYSDPPIATEPVTIAMIHGSDSSLPGVVGFGQLPEIMIPCNCGNWEPPTEAQIDQTRRAIGKRNR